MTPSGIEPATFRLVEEWCVYVASRLQHAVRMRRIILSFVACPSVLYFSTLSLKRHEFPEEFIGRKISDFLFYLQNCLKYF